MHFENKIKNVNIQDTRTANGPVKQCVIRQVGVGVTNKDYLCFY